MIALAIVTVQVLAQPSASDIERERLQLERQRLEVERQRLQGERAREAERLRCPTSSAFDLDCNLRAMQACERLGGRWNLYTGFDKPPRCEIE